MASNTGQEMQTALSWASQPPVALAGSSLVLSITTGHPRTCCSCWQGSCPAVQEGTGATAVGSMKIRA